MAAVLQSFLSLALAEQVGFASPQLLSANFINSSTALSPTSTCAPGAQHELCNVSAIQCDFYTCLESQYHCQGTPWSYPIDYGYKYCMKYGKTLNDFSTAGQQWIYDTRLCLQNAIVSEADCESNCKEIQEKAFASHHACYVDDGICTLFDDWNNIITTVGVEGLAAGGDQVTETIALCIAGYEKMATEELRRVVSAVIKLLTVVGEDVRVNILKKLAGPSKTSLVSLLLSAGVSLDLIRKLLS